MNSLTENPSPGVDIVIVNWNSGDQLRDALASINKHASDVRKSVFVVDNNSTDGSADNLGDDVTLLKNDINQGFGAACNQGSSLGQREYILFLNPDAALMQNSLQRCMNFLDDPNNSNIAICGAQLVDNSGEIARSCAKFPTPLDIFSKSIGLDRFFPALSYNMNSWSHAETKEVDHVIGAFYLVRRSSFEAANGFDENFFLYLEDLDLSHRISRLGGKTVYLSTAKAFHAGGGTSNKIKAVRLFYSLRSRIIYSEKYFNAGGYFLILSSTLILEPFCRIGISILKGSWISLAETWSGYRLLFCWLIDWFSKRTTR